MSTRAFLVAKAERDLKARPDKPAVKDKHESNAKLIALSGLSGAALTQVLAHSALGAGVTAGGRALFRTGRRAAANKKAVSAAKPQLIMPIARRHR